MHRRSEHSISCVIVVAPTGDGTCPKRNRNGTYAIKLRQNLRSVVGNEDASGQDGVNPRHGEVSSKEHASVALKKARFIDGFVYDAGQKAIKRIAHFLKQTGKA
ncbi:hypothetical protein PRIPAC_89451 [Pristionchus pacificus]|uniref:Uncharacterized protein n=1 Tax=Pristionchus pacificus TaxID=54126 RepID=A0A2A6CYM4_PRIPA|nr:hypothetical protein PRIPAC_89451 [Pristionchus pacificus]|eukprot:PDM83123.1 hypothetical protein PRIPAC_37516 [Pristionchus pacificus]